MRKAVILPWLRPAAKCKVTIEYLDNVAMRIKAVMLSTEQSPETRYGTLK